MNWGFRIVLLYSSFVVLILTLVYKASGEKVDLVTKDYYAQELVHTDKMNAVSRALPFKENVKVTVGASNIQISFPEQFENEGGNIDFYRPSDSALDQHFSLQIDENNQQIISSEKWPMGYYAIKIEWTLKGEKYLIEDTVFLP